MSQQEQDQIDERLKAHFANPNTRAAIASAVASNRPHGWSKHSKACYFRKCYADEILEHIDKQIETGQDLIFRYDIWCKSLNISEKTLYIRFNQAILFLLEKMDPEGKYQKWYDNVDIDCKKSKIGIIMSVAHIKDSKKIPVELIEPRQSLPEWRKQLMDWLESDSNEPFIKESIALSPDEIVSLRNEFLTNDGLCVDIKANKIAIIKA